MIPTDVHHLGTNYSLQHLSQKIHRFGWRDISDQERSFSVRVRYTSHCFTSKVVLPIPNDCYTCGPAANLRAFNADRYNWSLELPGHIDGLINRPTTQIHLTPENNGYFFRLAMLHPLGAGETYYCFLRLKPSPEFSLDDQHLKLDMFVESAYARRNRPTSKERVMFGRLAERVAR